MNSIRSYLALRLLVGFMLLLSLASILVYVIARRILESDFDSRLFAKAQVVMASTTRKADKLDVDWSNLPQEIGLHGKEPALVEFLDASAKHLEGENFLSGIPEWNPDRATYRNAVSRQGEKIRVLALVFTPPVEEEDLAITPPALRQPCLLVVGSDRRQLDHSLSLMAGVLGAMTILTSVSSLGIVSLVLRRGLRPLFSLGQEVSRIDVQSLDQRIDLHFLPVEIRPVAEKLNDLLTRLDASFARERRFSADVSHELRTPVAELKTLAEVMLQEEGHALEIRQAFVDARDIALQMEALVTVLLEMVRQDSASGPLALTVIDPGSAVRSAWKRLEAKAARREILLHFAPAQDFSLRADPRLLAMVLNNLLENAIDYSPAGARVEIECLAEGNSPVLTICNPAPDLTPSDLPHLFERFWRKDTARSDSSHFGMGLSLTQALCQRLEVQLTVSLTGDHRVCFRLLFPTPNPSHP